MGAFRVGVVGIGDISDVYIANLQRYPEIVEVVGCAGRDLAKAQAKSAQHGLARAWATGEDLVADPAVEIVLDLTTPAAHAGLNLLALRHGKHVYSEKPLAATFDASREILETARAVGLRVGCAPDTFMGGRLQTCRDLVDGGEFGDPVGASAFVVSPGHEFHHPNPAFFYEPGGGPILDIAPYYVIALVSLLGPVARVAAIGRRTWPSRTIQAGPLRGHTVPVDPGVDTHVTGILEFANGAIGTLIASFDVWDSELPKLELYGTRGAICIDDVDPLSGPNLFGGPILFQAGATSRWRGTPRPEPLPGWTNVPVTRPFAQTSHRDNSRGIGLVDMACAIRDGRPHRASGEMALHAMEVMEALLVSAREGRFHALTTTCDRPAPLPADFPAPEPPAAS